MILRVLALYIARKQSAVIIVTIKETITKFEMILLVAQIMFDIFLDLHHYMKSWCQFPDNTMLLVDGLC